VAAPLGGLPPPQLPRYPPYFPENAEPLWSEEQMTGAVNTALAKFGDLHLSRLPQIYDCDAPLVCTPALYDPHAERRWIRQSEVTVPDIHRAICEVYESTQTRQRALELAHRVAPEFADDPVDLIAGRVAALFR
jgi:hypothetical protein